MARVSHSKIDISSPDVWSGQLLYQILMSLIVGVAYILIVEIANFSASLDALTASEPGEAFITVSRLGAGLLMLVLGKDIWLALKAGMLLTQPAGKQEPMTVASAPVVSVIVPAFNEGTTIEDTLRSLLALDYPRLEIVVVDDGSSDDTLVKAQAIAAQSIESSIIVHSQANAGKWKALNEGIARCRGDLVLCIDADSRVSRDALQRMVPHFADPAIAAVSGQVQVRNQVNLLTRLQALEYLVANGSARTAQSDRGCVLIVPGPLGLFRRSVLAEVARTYFAANDGRGKSEGTGPFSPHTFAEDFELSVMICALGHKVVYEPAAISLTVAPETVRGLLSQRYRWMRGSMQVAARYQDGSWGRGTKSRALGWWMALSALGELYVLPVAGLLLLATLVWSLVIGETAGIFMLWMLVWVIHACIAAIFIHSHGERIVLAALSPLQGLYGVVLLTGVWTHAVMDHVVSRPMRW